MWWCPGKITLLVLALIGALPEVRGAPQETDPDTFLVKFGYLEPIPEGGQKDVAVRRRAIRTFQRFAGLPITGRMNRATLHKMAAPRCGNKDIEGSAQKYLFSGRKWGKKELTWKVWNTNNDMTRNDQLESYRRAFKYWEDVSALKFVESTGKSDINIRFAKGNHGDGQINAFDGEGKVLAHAFYPEIGEAHFDLAETWTSTGSRQQINLEVVAAHEFGHILGLGHSSNYRALMAPYYQGYQADYKLPSDDVNGITSLYGKAKVKGTAGATADPCNMKYEAIMSADGNDMFVLNSNKVWRLNAWTLVPGYPVGASTVFPDLPPGITAAFSIKTNEGREHFFFKRQIVYHYVNFKWMSRSRINGQSLPSRPEAVFQSRDGNVYVLQGSQYWAFYPKTKIYIYINGQVSRKISDKWPGIPDSVDAAIVLQGLLYVIKEGRYWKYDEFGRQVMPGYPRDVAPSFMGPRCGGAYIPK